MIRTPNAALGPDVSNGITHQQGQRLLGGGGSTGQGARGSGLAAAAVLALGVTLGPHAIRAQSLDEVVISVDTIAVLADSELLKRLPSPPISVNRDSNGRYWLIAPGQAPIVTWADGTGARPFGHVRSGNGAGPTFVRPVWSLPIADSIVVVDAASPKITIVGPELDVVRTIDGVPGFKGQVAALDWPRRVVMGASIFTPEAAGLPIHIVDLSGPSAKVIRSLTDGDSDLNFNENPEEARRRFWVTSGLIWSARALDYTIHVLDSIGTPLDSLVRHPEWFPAARAPDEPSPAFLNGVLVNEREVWTLLTKRVDESGSGGSFADVTYRSIVEVFDRKSHRLVDSIELHGVPCQVLENGTVAISSTDDDGNWSVYILRFSTQPAQMGTTNRRG